LRGKGVGQGVENPANPQGARRPQTRRRQELALAEQRARAGDFAGNSGRWEQNICQAEVARSVANIRAGFNTPLRRATRARTGATAQARDAITVQIPEKRKCDWIYQYKCEET